jgi:hypothetical protein
MKAGKPDLAGQVGGFVRDLFGKTPAPEAPAAGAGVSTTAAPIVPESRRLGLGNIKSVGLDGPLGVSIGLARDAKATEPDLTATLSFDGTGWRVTSLIPRI